MPGTRKFLLIPDILKLKTLKLIIIAKKATFAIIYPERLKLMLSLIIRLYLFPITESILKLGKLIK